MSTSTTASVSTHILDTSVGRPAEGVAVQLAARSGSGADWQALGGSATDADGRCKDLPALPEGTTHVRLDFDTETYFAKKQAAAQQDAPALRDSENGLAGVLPRGHHHLRGGARGALPRSAAAQPVRLLRLPRELTDT
ncbi:hydroxyisourate hydrolase [Streptomyces sp. UP1A-1]|nr:hydroxyisourate hydrolase [Streptomyces sp. UP1A-1]